MPAAEEGRLSPDSLWWRQRDSNPRSGQKTAFARTVRMERATENLSSEDRVFRPAGAFQVAGIPTGRRTRQILSVSSVAPVSWWSRQQAEERIRIAAGALFENRADNKLARMCVVMLHVKTVALIFSPCLNGTVTPPPYGCSAQMRFEH